MTGIMQSPFCRVLFSTHHCYNILCRQRNSDIVSQLVALYPVERLIKPYIVTILTFFNQSFISIAIVAIDTIVHSKKSILPVNFETTLTFKRHL